MRRWLFAILIMLLLAGCSESTICGYVVGKEFIPAHTEMQYDFIIFKRMMPKYHPDAYVVFVADSCCVHRINVDKGAYDRLRNGDYVTPKELYHGQDESY